MYIQHHCFQKCFFLNWYIHEECEGDRGGRGGGWGRVSRRYIGGRGGEWVSGGVDGDGDGLNCIRICSMLFSEKQSWNRM